VRYVSDLRRRRQLLVVRRVVIGFVGGLILIFGFVTQFSSLATFAGFISAGVAVGLQTILLSVAAYFFIIGRYGVRVGDRITVAGVTGTVIEVGIARFYMMELVGTGTELHSTGRVAVFANSVLFQTGTPLYKQLPGTEYAWHELTAKLKPEADAEAVSKAICDIIDGVYQTYKAEIESQQHQIESWMGAPVDRPGVDSHLRMVEEGLQIAILFPVQIAAAAKTDAAIAAAIFRALQVDGPLKQGLAALPTIKAAIKF
jgi:small-conductance mechanosensitive channel